MDTSIPVAPRKSMDSSGNVESREVDPLFRVCVCVKIMCAVLFLYMIILCPGFN